MAAIPSDASLTTTIRTAWNEAGQVLRAHGELAVLEAQRAGVNYLVLACICLGAVMVVVAAWISLLFAVLLWLGGDEISWPALLLIQTGINLVLAIALGLWARNLASRKPFEATLRQLRSDAASRRPSP